MTSLTGQTNYHYTQTNYTTTTESSVTDTSVRPTEAVSSTGQHEAANRNTGEDGVRRRWDILWERTRVEG